MCWTLMVLPILDYNTWHVCDSWITIYDLMSKFSHLLYIRATEVSSHDFYPLIEL